MIALLVALAFAANADPTPFTAVAPPTKEPKYANPPKYLLLVFGMKADAKVWLILDGDRLYVDRNGDGDLTQPGEVVQGTRKDSRIIFAIGDLKERDRTHAEIELAMYAPLDGSGLGKFPAWRALKKKDPSARMVSVQAQIDRRGLPGFSEPTDKNAKRTWSQDAGNDYFGCLQFTSSPREASVVHFNGPLTIGLQMPYLDDGMLVAGAMSEIETGVGCRGSGAGSFAFISYNPVPKTAHPTVEIQWPGNSPLERMTLGERC
jgi:hypothetical protein